MSKLTKAQRAAISGALDFMRQAREFIQSDRVRVVCVSDIAMLPEHTYTSGTGERCGSISKLSGSKLQYLDCAIRKLEALEAQA